MEINKFIYSTVIFYFVVHLCFVYCDGDHDETAHQAHQAGTATSQDALKYMKDTSHIREHLKDQYGFDDKRAEEYMKEYDAQTQYFVMHDYDGNKKLDGLELLKSMTHFHDDHEQHGAEHGEEGKKKEEEHHEHSKELPDQSEQLMEFVDMIMKDQDKNDDGYIDYPEYFDYYKQYTGYDSDSANKDAQEQPPEQLPQH